MIWGWIAAIVAAIAITWFIARRPKPAPPIINAPQSHGLEMTITPNGTIDDANARWHSTTGWLRADLVGKPLEDFVEPEARARLHADLTKGFTGARAHNFMLRMRGASHKEVHLWWRVHRTEDGMLQAFVRNMADAPQTRLEAPTLQVPTNVIGHRARNSISNVIGTARLLRDAAATTKEADWAALIEREGDVLMALFEDVVGLTSPVALDDRQFDLRECVESACQIAAPQAAGKGLELSLDFDGPLQVMGDSARIRQVLLALLSNSTKFTESGEIAVRVSGTSPTVFEISDTGVGIPAGKMKSVWRGKTSGLGLRVSRSVIEAMGGTIDLASDEGTTVTITLDLGVASTTPPDWAKADQFAGMRVVLVDDHETTRRLVQEQLEHWGITVFSDTHPVEALRLLEQPHDAVIVDHHMPGIDGIEWAQRGDEPAILLTSTMVGRLEMGPAGKRFAAVLDKPVRPAQLHAAICKVRGAELSPALPREMATQFPLRILVVEDNRVNQKVMELLLRRMGYDPIILSAGGAAVNMLHQQAFDAILMDLELDGLDGLEATRLIRKQIPAERQPAIIAMTAHTGDQSRKRAKAAGMDGFMAKPTTPDQLADNLEMAYNVVRDRLKPA